jgi:hypothetical protein
MNLRREWITPITAGAFLLSAVTGILIFFHLDTGFNKFAHEWLSWVLLGSVALHVTVNFAGFKYYFSVRRGQILIAAFALVLLLSFIPAGKKNEPPFVAPIRALSQAPLTTLAQVARVSPEQLNERLAKAGFQPKSDLQSLSDLVGPDVKKQAHMLKTLLADAK